MASLRKVARPPSPYADPSSPPSFALPAPLRHRLQGLRARHLGVLWTEGTSVIVCAVLAFASLQMLADWLLDLPRAVRAILLTADLGVIGWLTYRGLVLPWCQRLTTATAALRAEKAIPTLRGCLISAVQFAHAKPDDAPLSTVLVADVVACASAAASQLIPSRIIPGKRALKLAAAAFAFTALVVAALVWQSDRSGALLRRLVLSAEPLPTLTQVVAVTENLRPTIGSDVELVAKASGRLPRSGWVHLVHQGGKKESLPLSPDADDPSVFKLKILNVRRSLDYRFVLGDGRGPKFEVSPLPAPALAGLDAEEMLPAYTGLGTLPRTPASLSLLAGSTLKLRISATLPLKSATLVPRGAGEPVPMKLVGTTSASGELLIPPADLDGFSIALVSADGAPSVDDTLYRIQIIQDQPPVITLIKPEAENETITLRASPVIEFEVADDFTLTALALCYQVTTPSETEQETVSETVRIPFPLPEGAASRRISHPWPLAKITPPPAIGATLTYWIEAADNNTASGPGRSESRRQQFSIVSLEAKRAEILERIGQTGDSLKTISDKQRKLSEEIDSLVTPSPSP
ncbi:MAG: hypothetical protein K0R17_743 [Rariglobus sp.]|jgi:hypothetical protein|nr:hypothetical protein [Rariglobus sp.]